MKQLHKPFFTLLLLASFFCVRAQKKLPQTLLWRISGKQLQKPSYLFGTIHLSDERLFKFGDSLLHAIETSEGLAIEVNPEEMVAYGINKALDNRENSKPIKDVLGNKNFSGYSKRLSKKFGKPATEVTANDLLKEKNKWASEVFTKGDMNTFLDAWLYETAKKQGKWVGGIEDIMDQAGLIDDLIDQSDVDAVLSADKALDDSIMNKMIQKYVSQDLTFFSELYYQDRDALLVKRNIKMARRIDSLSAIRTTFFAVGTAHLPGEDGIIALLRQKGFTVEPVFSVKKIAAKDYKYKEVELPWQEVTAGNGSYKVSMPGTPLDLKVAPGVKINFYMDLLSMTGYGVMNIGSMFMGSVSRDSLFKIMADNMAKGQNVTLKPAENNGAEFFYNMEGMEARIQMYNTDNNFFVLMLMGFKKSTLTSPAATRFLQSFKIQPKTDVSSVAPMATFTDSFSHVSVTTPTLLEPFKELTVSDEIWDTRTFASTDATGAYYMLMIKETRQGAYLTGDSSAFKALYNGMKEKYGQIKTKQIMAGGIPALSMEGTLKGTAVYSRWLAVGKYNRQFILMSFTDSASAYSNTCNQVFNSLSFQDASFLTWQPRLSADSAFTTNAPAAFTSQPNIGNMQATRDPETAMSYFIRCDTLGQYTWFTSDSALYKHLEKSSIKQLIPVHVQPASQNGLTGWEWLTKEATQDKIQARSRVYINGDKVYTIFAVGDSSLLYNSYSNSFFNSFRCTVNDTVTSLRQPKAGLLLNNLFASDVETRQEAFSALSLAPFTKADIPLLQEALLKTYPYMYDSSETYSSYVNEKIGYTLANLADSNTVTFIANQFTKAPPPGKEIATALLKTLANLPNSYSYQTFARLAPGNASALEEASLSFKFKDSLALTASVYDSLLLLAQNPKLAPFVAHIGMALADTGYISFTLLQQHKADFIRSVKEKLPQLLKEKNSWDYDFVQLIRLLGQCKDSAANQALRSLFAVKDQFLKKEAVITLIKNGQQVPASVMLSLARDSSVRLPLYNSLLEIHKEALFPKQYLTRDHFALSGVYSMLDNESDTVTIKLAARRQAVYKGKKYLFYLYKITEGTGKEAYSYLGIAGGYSLTGTGADPEEDVIGYYTSEDYNAAKLTQQLEAYLKEYSGSDTEESEVEE